MEKNASFGIFNEFISLLTATTGIIPLAAHKNSILEYIKKRSEEIAEEQDSKNSEETNFKNYLSILMEDEKELNALINESTMNETYFFREEPQFEFLKNKVFSNFQKKRVNLWSVASSSGEEAYSLALLALSCGLSPTVTASDIDTIVLEKCRNGIYNKKKSMKDIDGKKFHNLLAPYVDGETVKFSDEIKSLVRTKKINLKGIEKNLFLPQNQDVVFLRNVFIYFNSELKKSVLQTITDKCLCEGGYLFVSINEIASIGADITPKNLKKENAGAVFYFRKKKAGEK